MPEIKFTPGPWSFRDGVVRCADGRPLHDGRRTVEENTGNARLIAAAPELLAALKRLVFNQQDDVPTEVEIAAWERAVEVIAEAEGKA